MTEIKIAVSHGTLREGREIAKRGNIPLIRFSERSASERGRKALRALRDSMSSLHSFVFVNV